MENESNKEVKIIDENYAQRFYDSMQDIMSERFQNISLDDDHEERIKNIFQKFLKFLKSKLLNIEDMPNQDFESQRNQQELQDYFQQLPDPNSSDFKEQMEQAISELLNQLLQNEQFQQQDGQQQDGQQQDGQQQNGQEQEGQQQDGQQQNGQQLDENIQRALQSLVNKSCTTVKEVDENFENDSTNGQNSQEQQEGQQQDGQLQNGLEQEGQQQDGQLQNGQEQEGQQQDGQQQNGQQLDENIQKAIQTLVDKSNLGDGEGQQIEGQPNLDEESQTMATYSDSDELTKLNVNWSNENVPRRREERSKNFEQARTEEELFKLFLKYLVKTNYYVKTYGLDKKNRRQIAKHFLLGLEHKIMTDTYSDVTEPLSFYIDMKGQCDELNNYNDFFRKLLNEKEISVYFGYGGKVVKYLRVKRSGANLDFSRCDMCHYFQNSVMLPTESDIGDYYESKIFSEQLPLEEFVRSHRLTRLIAFSDFDAAVSIIKSSALSKIYWFCTERHRGDIDYSGYSLMDFKGEFVIARDLSDVTQYFEHINEPNYESNQRKLQLGRR